MSNLKRIIIVDDNPEIPFLLKEMIEMEPEFVVGRIAANWEEFFDNLENETVDLALVDLSFREGQSGLQILEELRRRKMIFPVIIVSAHDENLYGLSSLNRGAAGFISKGNLVSELVQGIRAVLAGKVYVSGPSGPEIVNAARNP